MTLSIAFPNIDPVLVQIGPFAIRWYALAYITGLVLGWRYIRWLAKTAIEKVTAEDVDDYLVWATLGVVLGGRLGYVLFYKPGFYLAHPDQIFAVWQGGMSFHGGLIGVAVATVLFCRKRGIHILAFGDMVSAAAPIGLFFGRIANFINGELFGRVTDVPWGVVFPRGGPVPRHPSQLYEAFLEGLVLFAILALLWARPKFRACHGLFLGVLLVGYGAGRTFVELFREPDAHLGFLIFGTTMGQLLSVPMFVAGGVLIWHGLRQGKEEDKTAKAADGRSSGAPAETHGSK